jgi:hypothetical protein
MIVLSRRTSGIAVSPAAVADAPSILPTEAELVADTKAKPRGPTAPARADEVAG